MTTIVIGGHSRKVGKTAVTEGLIQAFSRYPWTAAKISTHWHENPPDRVFCDIREEKAPGDRSDSARYLAAGAARSFWVRVRQDRLAECLPALQPVLHSSRHVIIESNCVLQLIIPDLYVLVLRADVEDFKESARDTLGSADAILVVASGSTTPVWKDLVQEKAAGIPLFETANPFVLPQDFIKFVNSRI